LAAEDNTRLRAALAERGATLRAAQAAERAARVPAPIAAPTATSTASKVRCMSAL
jgi:hypothetical protein